MPSHSIFFVALTFGLVACGGNETQATAEDVSALCLAYCEKASACAPAGTVSDEDKTECTDSCSESGQAASDPTCLGYYADALTCATNLSCEDLNMGNQDLLCAVDDIPETCFQDSQSTVTDQ